GLVASFERFVAGSDAWSAWKAMTLAWRHLDDEGWQHLVSTTRARHGGGVDAFLPAITEQRRQGDITLRRAGIHDADPRFLLALLLNVPNRETILRMVGERYPGEDPVKRVLATLTVLADQKKIGHSFDAVSLAVMEGMLRGRAFAQILTTLETTYGKSEV